MSKKIFAVLLTVVLIGSVFTACSSSSDKETEENGKISVVTTIFPQYDFVRQIAGDNVDLKMLLNPGDESHNYEASLSDISLIKNCDLFIYVGGEGDAWVDDILSTIDESSNMQAVALTSLVDTVEESSDGILVGEEEEDANVDGEEEVEKDEHVWTSLRNSQTIVTALADKLSSLDEDNADIYKTNAQTYNSKLASLDTEYKEMMQSATKDTVVIADRFPFRYLFDDYGIKHVAAFAGCSSNQEITLETQNNLIKAIKENNINHIFVIEFNTGSYADAICKSTGATKSTLHSCHNITKQDFDNGVTYYDLMKQNLSSLKEALA